jgi:hypothetical protein
VPLVIFASESLKVCDMRIPLSHYILSCSTDEDGKFGAVVGCSQQSRPGNIG